MPILMFLLILQVEALYSTYCLTIWGMQDWCVVGQ